MMMRILLKLTIFRLMIWTATAAPNDAPSSSSPSNVPSNAPSAFALRQVTFLGFPLNSASGATAEIAKRPGNLIEASTVELAPEETIKYRVRVNGYTGPWNIYTATNGTTQVLDVSAGFAEVTVLTPSKDTHIQIQKVDAPLSNGDTIILPAGRNYVAYRAFVGRLFGQWKGHNVPFDQPTVVFDASGEFGSVSIAIPPVAAAAGATVEFRRIFDDKNDGSRATFRDGDSLFLPHGVPAYGYRVAVSGNYGPWGDMQRNTLRPVVLDTSGHFVAVVVGVPQDATTAGAIIKMRKVLDSNGEEREFHHGDAVILPARGSVDWRVVVNSVVGSWTTFRTRTKAIFTLDTTFGLQAVQFVGLSALAGADSIPPSIEIKRVQRLITAEATTPLVVPINSTISWRAVVNGYKGDWTTHYVGGFGSIEQLDIQDEFCLVTTGNSGGAVFHFVGGLAPKDVSGESTLNLLAGTDAEYRVKGVSGESTFSVPASTNCPATLNDEQARTLLRHG